MNYHCSIRHHVIEHNDTYVEGEGHTNTIEGFWMQLKRAWYGTHTQYSPTYAAEATTSTTTRDADDLFDGFLRRVMGG